VTKLESSGLVLFVNRAIMSTVNSPDTYTLARATWSQKSSYASDLTQQLEWSRRGPIICTDISWI
jgi:hypothetical protein